MSKKNDANIIAEYEAAALDATAYTQRATNTAESDEAIRRGLIARERNESKENPVASLIQVIKTWLRAHPKTDKALATINIVGGSLQATAGIAVGVWAIISISSLASSISLTASAAITVIASSMGSSSPLVIASLVVGALAGIGMIAMGVLTHKKHKQNDPKAIKNLYQLSRYQEETDSKKPDDQRTPADQI